MSQPSSSASQPIPSSTSGTVYQGQGAWLSSGAIPDSQSRLQDATNLLGLNLPPNTLKVIAQYQAGRFPPALLNPLQQPIQGPANPVAASRTNPTARAHAQPNLRKSRAPSAYSRGVVPKPVAQTLEAACYFPPPMKARNRRTAKSRAKETAPPVASGPPNPNWSVGAARVASQGDATPNTASLPDDDLSAKAKIISDRPGFQYLPIKLLKQALSLMELEGKDTTSLVAGGAWSSRSAISNSKAHSESPSPRGTGVPAVDVAGLHPRSESLSPTTQSEGSPLVEQPQLVPTIGGDDAGDPMAFSVAMPTQFPDWYPTMDAISEWEMPATGLLSMEAPTSGPEHPSTTSLMLEEFDAIIQSGGSDVTTPVNEQNDGPSPSSSQEYTFDVEHSLAEGAARSETQLALPTREDFEGFFSALPNHPSPSAESGREVFMGEAGAEGFVQTVDDFNEFLSGGWEKYVDFEGPERV